MTTTSTAPGKKKKRRWGRKLRNWFVGRVGPWILRAWMGTLRCRFVGNIPVKNGRPEAPARCICVFWHQQILLLSGLFRDSGFRILISQHGDGDMGAKVLEGLGMRPVRGSSTRGGARACLEILRDKGDNGRLNVGITPDGPRGPSHVFQNGAIFLASRTGLPLYPVAIRVRRCLRLPSWDRLILPCPFTRAILNVGEPMIVKPDIERAEVEVLRQEAERRLRELTDLTERDLDELYRTARRT